jgi:hypothetical protein
VSEGEQDLGGASLDEGCVLSPSMCCRSLSPSFANRSAAAYQAAFDAHLAQRA